MERTETMKCRHCGEEIPDKSEFCPRCGQRILRIRPKQICSKCGAEVPEGADHCPGCGGKVVGKRKEEGEPGEASTAKAPFSDALIPLSRAVLPGLGACLFSFLFLAASGRFPLSNALLFYLLLSGFFAWIDLRRLEREGRLLEEGGERFLLFLPIIGLCRRLRLLPSPGFFDKAAPILELLFLNGVFLPYYILRAAQGGLS